MHLRRAFGDALQEEERAIWGFKPSVLLRGERLKEPSLWRVVVGTLWHRTHGEPNSSMKEVSHRTQQLTNLSHVQIFPKYRLPWCRPMVGPKRGDEGRRDRPEKEVFGSLFWLSATTKIRLTARTPCMQ